MGGGYILKGEPTHTYIYENMYIYTVLYPNIKDVATEFLLKTKGQSKKLLKLFTYKRERLTLVDRCLKS
jgi:hypothetical protein